MDTNNTRTTNNAEVDHASMVATTNNAIAVMEIDNSSQESLPPTAPEPFLLNSQSSMNSTTLGSYKLVDLLKELQQKTHQLMEQRQASNNVDGLQIKYQNEILPILLRLRQANRREKDELELKSQKTKDLNSRLQLLDDGHKCLKFEAAVLGDRIARFKLPPLTELNGLDHETKMVKLDEEEAKRRRLQEALAQLNNEVSSIEHSSLQGSKQLNIVKPYIRQLLDKIGPTLHETPQTSDVRMSE